MKMSGLNILAIIPARGGSKRLPGKNIKPLVGKPLIAWTIEQAKKSSLIGTVIVNTDSPQIAKIAKRYGALVPFLRPAHLATDTATSADMVLHTLKFYEQSNVSFDIIVLLEPTSPLRADDDIDKALTLFIKKFTDMDGLVSVGAVHLEKPDILKKVTRGTVAPLFKKSPSEGFFPYGVIYAVKTSAFKKHPTFYQKKTLAYPLERWQNYEIDDLYDFLCIEAVLKNRLARVTL